MAQYDDARLAEVLAAVVEDGDTKALFRRLLEHAQQELIETELDRHDRRGAARADRVAHQPA